MRPSVWNHALVVAVTAAGCATANRSAVLHAPMADVATLEAVVVRDPANARAHFDLAAALLHAGRAEPAARAAEAGIRLAPGEPYGRLVAGLAAEACDDLDDAVHQLRNYLALVRDDDARLVVETRLRTIEERRLAKATLAEAARRGEAAPPTPRTLAMFTLSFAGEDSTHAPIARAVSALLTTDLTRVDRVRLLERARIDAILDEFDLAKSGRVDLATAPRAGRLLRAERVFAGVVRVAAGRIDIQAAVTPSENAEAGRRLAEADALDQTLDAERRLALSIFDVLGIELTMAERERVGRHGTANLEALLAYGRGLEASDAGDWARAAAEFRRAAELDPGFREAADRAEEATIREAAAALPYVDATSPRWADAGEVARPPVVTLYEGLRSRPELDLDPLRTILPDPIFRDAGAEAFGREGLGALTLLRVVLIHP